MSEIKNISVIGAGSFGTPLAKLLAEKGYPVKIWAYEEDVCDAINNQHENTTFLPGFKLPDNLAAGSDMAAILDGADMVLVVPPSHVYRRVIGQAAQYIKPGVPVISATKGIENGTSALMSDILEELIGDPDRLAYISGPTFGKELAQKIPSAATIVSRNIKTAELLQQVFTNEFLRIYTNTDVVGVELGGALKNIIALASGVAEGLGYGANTRAALITRGLAEITRVGVKKGAKPQTFMGMAGLGDLMLTASSTLSRNFTVGRKLGEGMTLKQIMEDMKMVAEGVKNTESAYNMAQKLGVEMPITEQMYAVLYQDKPVKDAVADLLARPLVSEIEDFG
jgi:glycerol-3-phosphate dehydrogenase (NAD(P)+)